MPTSDRSRLWHLLQDIRVPARLPRLLPERLRSTWLVHHLDKPSPIPPLLAAAGLKSTKAFTLLLPYLDQPDPGAAAALLADRET